MPKFVKNLIEKKRAVTSAIKLKAMFKGQMGLYTFYSIWFSTIKAYAKGYPSKVKQLAWKTYVIPFIPGDWTCTDEGYEKVSAKRRCKLIQYKYKKKGNIPQADKDWLLDELYVEFEKDFAKKNLDFDKLGDMDDEKIEANLFKVKKTKFKEMLK